MTEATKHAAEAFGIILLWGFIVPGFLALIFSPFLYLYIKRDNARRIATLSATRKDAQP